eukprot:scaffold1987_cov72-Isochrysis_galbana.AAC.1
MKVGGHASRPPPCAVAGWAQARWGDGVLSCVDLRNEWLPHATEPTPIAILQVNGGRERYAARGERRAGR